MNYFQDDKLARAGRDWSWDTIRRKVAIDKPDKLQNIKLKSYDEKAKARKKSILKKTKYMIDLGFTPEFVSNNRTASYSFIKVNTGKLFGKEVASPVDDNERFQTWKYWSIKENHNFPKDILKEIHNINLSTKPDDSNMLTLDINSKYGFALTYFMYFNELELNDAKKIIEPDFVGGDYLYQASRRVK